MSIVSCFFMIFLLCLSKQSSCKARHIRGDRHKGIFAHAEFHYSSKGVVKKVQFQVESTQLGGIMKGSDHNYGVNNIANHHDKAQVGATTDHDDDQYSPKNSRPSSTTYRSIIKKQLKDKGGVLKNRPLVYVSWGVPSKNQDTNHHSKDRHNPGFYSDYSRPRTRPPSHN